MLAARRGDVGAGRRHGEHEPGAARAARRARAASGSGPAPQLEDSLFVALKDSYCGLLHGADLATTWRASTASRASSRTSSRCARTSARNTANNNGRFAEEIVPVEVKQGKKSGDGREGRPPVPRAPRSRGSPRCPPAFGPESIVTAGNASGIVDGAAARGGDHRGERAQAAGKTPLGVRARLGARRRRPGDHGHRPGARDPQGARARRADARRRSTCSRSTRRSPASTWRSRRSSASTARR